MESGAGVIRDLNADSISLALPTIEVYVEPDDRGIHLIR